MSGLVVAGGGPAGAAVACLLAEAAREVVLLEREAGPVDKVCGDFLSIEAQRSAASLGLDLRRLAPAPIVSLRLLHRERAAETVLPFPALGLSRRVFDEALLALAADRGATVRRGSRVVALRARGERLFLATAQGEIEPEAVFLATGKHDLRGAQRAARAPKSVAFKTYFSLSPAQTEALRGTVEVMLFRGGYAGLLLVEGEAANLSLVVSARELSRAGGSWNGLLQALTSACPHLAQRLRGATPHLTRPLAIGRLPYGFMHAPHPADPPGLFRLGDQAAVIPSFTGDGVAIALHSGRSAGSAWLSGRTAVAYHQDLRRDISLQMQRASLLHAGCLAPHVQPALVAACGLFPGLMRLAAAWTRIPRAAQFRAVFAS